MKFSIFSTDAIPFTDSGPLQMIYLSFWNFFFFLLLFNYLAPYPLGFHFNFTSLDKLSLNLQIGFTAL